MFGKPIDYQDFKNAMQKVTANPPWVNATVKAHREWNPYSMEGGTTAAIAGEDFVVAASDSRMSQQEVNILTRSAKKIHILNDNVILNTAGFYGDVLQLNRVLVGRLHKFRFDYRKDMTVDYVSEMLARTLYYKRFFPYYTGVVLSGIDEHGKGAVYSYDPIGCIERLPYSCSGAGEPILQPFFDNQIAHMTISKDVEMPEMTLERAKALITDGFRFVAERETSTGDSIHVVVAKHNSPVESYHVPLRED